MGVESRTTFPSSPCPGEVFLGKYRIERLVGEGGMGLVYAAHHEMLDTRVAIKLLSTSVAKDPDNILRFLNEARLAARIKSEHVCGVVDVGTIDDGRPYMVMEFLEGIDLANLLRRRGPLPVTEVVDFVMQALEGLAQAHARGIIHRDLKPSNLFLAEQIGTAPVLKVLDFGISKIEEALSAPGQGGITSSRAILGSPSYMSPEQIKSSRTVDARADVWGIGVILYELMTGVLPFEAEASGAIFAKILEEDPVPLAVQRPDAPPGIEAIVARCLRRKKEERFASVVELAQALAPYCTAPDALLQSVRAAATKQYRSHAESGIRVEGEPIARSGRTFPNAVPHSPPSHPTHASWSGNGRATLGQKNHGWLVLGLVGALGLVFAGASFAAYKVVFSGNKEEVTKTDPPPAVMTAIPIVATPIPAASPPAASATIEPPAPISAPSLKSPVRAAAAPVQAPIPPQAVRPFPPAPRPNKKDLLKDRN